MEINNEDVVHDIARRQDWIERCTERFTPDEVERIRSTFQRVAAEYDDARARYATAKVRYQHAYDEACELQTWQLWSRLATGEQELAGR